MQIKVLSQTNGVELQIAATATETGSILQALQACQTGRCTCPTQAYDKVASIHIEASNEGIQLSVRTKEGEQLDPAEVERCLAHSVGVEP